MTNASYKTIAGGSIDYGHYIAQSHRIRSEGAHAGLRAIWKGLKAVLAVRAPRFGTGSKHAWINSHRLQRHPLVRASRRADSGWRRDGLPCRHYTDAA
jgi:hypothetical protein